MSLVSEEGTVRDQAGGSRKNFATFQKGENFDHSSN